MMFDTW